MLASVRECFAMVNKDQKYMQELFPERFKPRNSLVALLRNPSLKFTFWTRMARHQSFIGRFGRKMLIRGHSSDVSPGPRIVHGLYVPHPVGIVIGSGVVFDGNVTLYQHVTLGVDRSGDYPTLEEGCKIFPHSMVYGGVTIGAGATVGAGIIVNSNVPPGEIVRRTTI